MKRTHTRIRCYRDLLPGDVFSLQYEGDGRRYMKLADSHAIDTESRVDCIPTPNDRCIYHYTVNTDNSIYRRKA